MLQRDDLLRMARIIDYDRFFTPSLGMMNDPSFEYEYVQSAIHKPLDTGGYCITWQSWKKAQRGSAYDPCMTENEMKRKVQHNEVRALKDMKTSELKTMLQTLPLEFKFDNGTRAVVLPKLPNKQHEVYVRWSTTRNLYANQYSLVPGNYEYQHWFNEEFNKFPRQDWRYLLSLNENNSVKEDATDELQKYFMGVYTDDIDFRLKKGTEIYMKKFGLSEPENVAEQATKKKEKRIRLRRDLRPKSKPRINYAPERQKMVCIKDPKNGNVIRIAKYFTGKFIKNGFTFVPKEEYKLQQKLKFEKRKDMAEGNREAQLLKYKGPKEPNKPRGIAGSPYTKYQIISSTYTKGKDGEKIKHFLYPIKDSKTGKRYKEGEIETLKVKQLVPEYEYKPMVWEIWEKGEKNQKIKLLETIPFLDKDGEPIVTKHLIGNKEEWVTIKRKVEPVQRTIKVLQIPSKKMTELKATMSEVKFSKKDGAKLLLPTIRSQRTKFLLSEDKNGKRNLETFYCEKENVKRPEYKTYLVIKRDGFGKVVNIVKRKLVK